MIPSALEKDRWVPLRLERRRLTPAGALASDESEARADGITKITATGYGEHFEKNGRPVEVPLWFVELDEIFCEYHDTGFQGLWTPLPTVSVPVAVPLAAMVDGDVGEPIKLDDVRV